MTELELPNKYFVGIGDDKIVILNPPAGAISKDDALLLAIWLVALADPLDEKFRDMLARVRGT